MSRAVSYLVRAAAGVLLTCGVSLVLGQTTNPQAQVSQPQPKHTLLDPEINRPPDANQIMLMREQQAKKKNFEAANTERKRQLAEDSALLLKLAGELKTEIGKTSAGALGPDAMRKLEDIERLARNVQQKMKLTMGAS